MLRFHPVRPLLAAVAGSRAEITVWSWSDGGSLEDVTRIVQEGSPRVRDLAWHPIHAELAVVSAGRAIEVWSTLEGKLVREYGFRPKSTRTIEFCGHKMHFSVEEQGYGNVIFSTRGDLIVAGVAICDPTEVYHVDSGELVDTFWRSGTFASHPEGEILATLSSNQQASALRFGTLSDRFQGYDAQLNLIIDGYKRLVFSPTGDAFAVMGHSYGIGIQIFEFPSCRLVFQMDFEEWEEVWTVLWKEYGELMGLSPRPDGRYPYEFICNLWTVNDRIAFHPDGHSLLFSTIEGYVARVDLSDTSHASGYWKVHDGPALALDVSTAHCVMATARSDGEIKLWRHAPIFRRNRSPKRSSISSLRSTETPPIRDSANPTGNDGTARRRSATR